MFEGKRGICKVQINKKRLFLFIYVCIQSVVIALSMKYFLTDVTPWKYINIKNKKPANSSLYEYTLPATLELNETVSSLYFVPERTKQLYIWKKDGVVKAKATAAFTRGMVAREITNTICAMSKNKTVNSFEGNDNQSCTAWRAVDDVNKFAFQEELDMPTAYSILVYTDFEMLEILLRTIHKPHHIYCIHVDAKSPNSFRERVDGLAKCFDNVFVATKLYRVSWGTFSVVQAEISCMEDLLNKSRSWKYFINLTGQEFPLRTNYEIAKVLHALRGFNKLSVECKNLVEIQRLALAGPVPYGLTVYKAAAHVVLTRQFVEYLFTDERAKNVTRWFENVEVPDEMLFPTLICNKKLKAPGSSNGDSSLGDQTVDSINRHKLWDHQRREKPCHGTYVRNICIFGPRDLDSLQNSHKLFVNKLHIHSSPEVPYCLLSTILRRTALEYSGYIDFNVSYYSKLPHKH